MKTMPKSYLSAEKRAELLREDEGDEELLYLVESQEAGRAGDEGAAWAWLSLVALPADTLMGLKDRRGAQFIRDMNLNTIEADTVYGSGWLDGP